MADVLIAILNSELVQTLVVMIVGAAMVKVYAKAPKVQTFMEQYRGEMIRAIKLAEKEIPNDVPNQGLQRLDKVLNYLIKIVELAENRKLTTKEVTILQSNISEVHNDISNLPEFSAPELGA